MNREHWKELLPVITAFANGEDIQKKCPAGWIWLGDPNFGDEPSCYRIAPKPRKIWVNEYRGHFATWPTKEDADKTALDSRIACHEIELPPLP